MKSTILALALFASASAYADSFDMGMSGTGVTLIDGNVTSAPFGSNVAFGWAGNLHIETDASSDGVYSGARLTSFTARGAMDGVVPYAVFGFDIVGSGLSYGDFPNYGVILPTVTLTNGRVSAVTGSLRFLPTSGTISFAGMSVSQNGVYWHQGTTYSSGTIAAPIFATYAVPVTPVPEPETYAMLLAGLAALRFRSSLFARRSVSVGA